MLHRLALISTIALIVGCHHVNAPIEARVDPYTAPQIAYATKDLRNKTAVGQLVVQRDDAGNLLHVTLPIRSAVNRRIVVDYRVAFLDRAGATIMQTGWMPKVLESNTPDSITVNSTSDRAADFVISLRQAE